MTLPSILWLTLPILVSCADINYDEPVSALDWAKGAGAGFSTNYFKTDDPMRKYNEDNVIHVKEAGFGNLRLRSSGSIHTTENATVFNEFLDNLETVVDDCIRHGITPIISWLHHDAEIHPSEAYRQQYVQWWTGVAERLKDKNYRLEIRNHVLSLKSVLAKSVVSNILGETNQVAKVCKTVFDKFRF